MKPRLRLCHPLSTLALIIVDLFVFSHRVRSNLHFRSFRCKSYIGQRFLESREEATMKSFTSAPVDAYATFLLCAIYPWLEPLDSFLKPFQYQSPLVRCSLCSQTPTERFDPSAGSRRSSSDFRGSGLQLNSIGL